MNVYHMEVNVLTIYEYCDNIDWFWALNNLKIIALLLDALNQSNHKYCKYNYQYVPKVCWKQEYIV